MYGATEMKIKFFKKVFFELSQSIQRIDHTEKIHQGGSDCIECFECQNNEKLLQAWEFNLFEH